MQLTELAVKCALLLLLSGAALFFDLKTGKIPNVLLFFGLLAGCIYRIAVFGPEGILSFCAGAAFPFFVLFILFRLGMMGAGDIKLLMAAGGLSGWPGSLRLFVLSILFGAIVSAVILTRRVRLRDRVRYFRTYAADALMNGRVSRYRMEGERPENIHFAVPVFLAAAAECVLELAAICRIMDMMG